jgi:hypothetical protein
MPLFGFAGHFAGRHTPDSLQIYGGSLAGGQAPAAVTDGDWVSRCWAPDVSTDGGITVVLEGRPLRRSGSGGAAGPQGAAQLLEAFREAGEASICKLHGRFAVAVIDVPSRRVVLAIDPMGIGRMTFHLC